jgi:hypothetical protein
MRADEIREDSDLRTASEPALSEVEGLDLSINIRDLSRSRGISEEFKAWLLLLTDC